METDVIGGFPVASPFCLGCGKKLELENAWMTDGCPCNHVLGVNSMNETRWRLLMQLQQEQSRRLAAIGDVPSPTYDTLFALSAHHTWHHNEENRLREALNKIEALTHGGKGESAVHIIASTALRPQPR